MGHRIFSCNLISAEMTEDKKRGSAELFTASLRVLRWKGGSCPSDAWEETKKRKRNRLESANGVAGTWDLEQIQSINA